DVYKRQWDEMWTLYAASDVVVGRAGALTCAEIMRMRKPALLVPHPACADQHQLFNATELERLGAAVVVEQKNLSSKGTTSLLSLLLNSRRREKAVEVYEKNDSLRVAEEKIAEEIVREVLEDNRDGKISQVVANRRTRSFVFDCGAA
ncbi:MAG: hypothetical protein N2234_07040, partial [Planctomycetota bacterium]|nr:hypothetical protein [Planctomycetota bacterium]